MFPPIEVSSSSEPLHDPIEARFDRLVPHVVLGSTFTGLFVGVAMFLGNEALSQLRSPLGDRPIAWAAAIASLLALVVSGIAAHRIPFDPRWLRAAFPLLALSFVAAQLEELKWMAAVSALGGALIGQSFRIDRSLLRRRPDLHVRRLVLPLVFPRSFALAELPPRDALPIASRRSWKFAAWFGAACVVLGAVLLLCVPRPSMRPQLRQLADAWNANDVHAVVAVAHESARPMLQASLERWSRERAPGLSWPAYSGWETVEQFGRTKVRVGDELLRTYSLRLHFDGTATPAAPSSMTEGTLVLGSSWVFADGQWWLVSLGPLPPS